METLDKGGLAVLDLPGWVAKLEAQAKRSKTQDRADSYNRGFCEGAAAMAAKLAAHVAPLGPIDTLKALHKFLRAAALQSSKITDRDTYQAGTVEGFHHELRAMLEGVKP